MKTHLNEQKLLYCCGICNTGFNSIAEFEEHELEHAMDIVQSSPTINDDDSKHRLHDPIELTEEIIDSAEFIVDE